MVTSFAEIPGVRKVRNRASPGTRVGESKLQEDRVSGLNWGYTRQFENDFYLIASKWIKPPALKTNLLSPLMKLSTGHLERTR